MSEVSIALVHHPVLDRAGEVVTTAITNLDLHDIARSARTYGLGAFHVVHPVAAQRLLAERVREHWVEGSGKRRIPDRAVALERIVVTPSLDATFELLGGRDRLDLWTTAARGDDVTAFSVARERLEAAEKPILILFGTGWGLAKPLIASADVRLEPIRPKRESGYNHLSVRAACAIVLDRLFG
jgi:hypothetical protein